MISENLTQKWINYPWFYGHGVDFLVHPEDIGQLVTQGMGLGLVLCIADDEEFITVASPTVCWSNLNVLPKQFKLEPYVDYDRQFEAAFLKPLSLICDAIGWKTKEVSSLEAFL
jgi:hypothetical protein